LPWPGGEKELYEETKKLKGVEGVLGNQREGSRKKRNGAERALEGKETHREGVKWGEKNDDHGTAEGTKNGPLNQGSGWGHQKAHSTQKNFTCGGAKNQISLEGDDRHVPTGKKGPQRRSTKKKNPLSRNRKGGAAQFGGRGRLGWEIPE